VTAPYTSAELVTNTRGSEPHSRAAASSTAVPMTLTCSTRNGSSHDLPTWVMAARW